jgi:prepilin-type N-terminal cleavage/methylation domain-containing protein
MNGSNRAAPLSRFGESAMNRRKRGLSAFSLLEVVIALTVVATASAGSYVGFSSVNTLSVTARLYSEAQTAAQNQIDLVLSKSPFDVVAAYRSGTFDQTKNQVPIQLMTLAELNALSPQPLSVPPPKTNKYYPYYRDASVAGAPLAREAFIYQDPETGQVIVTGTLRSVVTDTSSSMNFISVSALNVRKVNVSVSYSFRAKPYTVLMDTLRTADQ